MTDLFVRAATLVLLGISLIAFMITLDVFFAGKLDRTRQAIAAQPGRSFLIGLVNALFFGSISIGFLYLAGELSNIFVLPAIVILTPLAIAVVLGTGGMVALTGERLFPDHPRPKQIAFSAAMLYIACLAPIIGWFALTGYLAITGLGGFILSFLKREEEPVNSGQ